MYVIRVVSARRPFSSSSAAAAPPPPPALPEREDEVREREEEKRQDATDDDDDDGDVERLSAFRDAVVHAMAARGIAVRPPMVSIVHDTHLPIVAARRRSDALRAYGGGRDNCLSSDKTRSG